MDYSTLKKQISNDISKDKELLKVANDLNKKIKSNNATYSDVVKFSKHLGDTTSKVLLKYGIPEEELGIYAEEIVAPIFRQMQKSSISASKMVQKLMNDTNGIGISPAVVNTDESRISHIITRFKEASNVDDVSFLVGKDVAENIARSAVTDSLKANATQFDRLGFTSFVIREGSGCCEWCDSMTGIYKIGEEPDDFWRIHKNCTCSFEYKCNGTHDKISFTTDKGFLIKDTQKIK